MQWADFELPMEIVLEEVHLAPIGLLEVNICSLTRFDDLTRATAVDDAASRHCLGCVTDDRDG